MNCTHPPPHLDYIVKSGEYLGLDKEAIFTLLTKAIQEQQSIIEDLTKRIEGLES